LFVLIKNPFVDGDGHFLCLQNGINSPQKIKSITSLIFISKIPEFLDKVYNNLNFFLNLKNKFDVGTIYGFKVGDL